MSCVTSLMFSERCLPTEVFPSHHRASLVCMSSMIHNESWFHTEKFSTFITFIIFLPCMNPLILNESEFPIDCFLTVTAFIVSLSYMNSLIFDEGCLLEKGFPIHCIHRISLLNEFSGVLWGLSSGWWFLQIHSIHKASLQCEFFDGQQGWFSRKTLSNSVHL